MTTCGECGAAVDDDARWCGRCGAPRVDPGVHREPEVGGEPYLDDVATEHDPVTSAPSGDRAGATSTPATGAVAGAASDGGGGAVSGQGVRDRPTGRVALVGLAALVLVGLLVGGDASPDDPDGPAPTAAPDPGPELVERWRIDDVVRLGDDPDDDVRRLGPDHVQVGARVADTTDDPNPFGPRRLPAGMADVEVGPDGRWAVAEAGLVVTGSIGVTGTGSTEVAGGWAPAGPAVAWSRDAPVFRGTDGRLGAVGPDGTVRWTTRAPVDPTGPRGEGLLVGTDGTGDPVAVDTADGSVTALPAGLQADAVVAGLVVGVLDADVVGVRPGDARPAWRRAQGPRRTRVAGLDTLLEVEFGEVVVNVDPRTGRDRWTRRGVAGVPVDGGAVLRVGAPAGGGDLVRLDTAGVVRWRRTLPAGAGLRAGLGDVVAVAVPGRDRATVRLYDAASGEPVGDVLRDDRVPRRVPGVVAQLGGVVGITGTRLPEVAGAGWVVAATGADGRRLAREALGPDPSQLVGAPVDGVRQLGPVRIASTRATDDPFGSLPPVLTVFGREGRVRWEARALSPVGPLGPNPRLVGPVGSEFGPVVVEVGTAVLRARDLTDGEVRWTRVMSAPVVALPVHDGARLVVPLADGRVVGLDPARGTDVWTSGPHPVATSVASASGVVLLGSDDGRVLRLDSLGRPTGEWLVDEGRGVAAVVAVDDVVLAVTATAVVALGPDDGTVATRDRVDVRP